MDIQRLYLGFFSYRWFPKFSAWGLNFSGMYSGDVGKGMKLAVPPFDF
jgi:hypothetical protein